MDIKDERKRGFKNGQEKRMLGVSYIKLQMTPVEGTG
jgi:hypothetical protein